MDRGAKPLEVSRPRTVSVLFSDVVGSTELFTAMGDDAADALRREHFEGVGAVIADHRGQVVKHMGDGVMAVFDSAAGAAEAGVAIQQCSSELAAARSIDFAVRVGVTAGDASSEGDDWFGTPVVEAARLCATAGPGQVLASDLVRSLAGTRTSLRFHSLGTRALKGLPALVHVHEVRASVGAPVAVGVRRPEGERAVRPSRFRIIGAFTVEAGGEPVADGRIGSRKARLLLKLLVAKHGRHVPMDTIIDALWSGAVPSKAVANVATLTARLRAALGSDVIEGGRSGYRLVVPPGCTIDVGDAERLVEEAERRLDAAQPALAATAAAHALDLLGSGRPLEEESAEGEWLDELRREVERLVRRARVASWRASAGIGEHRRALAVAEEAVNADPLDEEAHRAVMTAYHRLGEAGEALAAFERARSTLVEELGAEPGPDTQELYLAVLRGDPVRDDAGRAVGGGSQAQLVGRDAELAALTRCWDEAIRAVPSCVVIVGESGIGKTRLLDELGAEVRATGGVVAEARCYEAEESLFLQPIVEVLRSIVATVPSDLVARAAEGRAGPLAALVPELSRLVGAFDQERTSPEMERRQTFEAVAGFLAELSRQRPVLVVLDDLQFAPPSTVDLVHFALRWDRSARLLFAAATPDDADLVARLGVSAVPLRIGGLTASAVAELAAATGHAELAAEVMERTRGHTLFVLETLRALAGDGSELVVPESLRATVTARVSRCGPEVEEFLRAAVVAGSVFDVEPVADLLELPGEEAVRRAELALRAHLLEESGARYEFANDTIRQVLYDTTPAPTRALRHRRLAFLLADRPEAAAEHAAGAGEWELAVDHWLLAANGAVSAFANAEAELLATRALDACSVLGDPARTSQVHLLRGRARLAMARYRDAGEDLTVAQALARADGDLVLEAAAIEELGWCACHAREMGRWADLAERAVRHPAAGPGAGVLVGRLRNAQGDLAGAAEVLEPIASLGDGSADSARAMSYLGTVLVQSDRLAEASDVLERAAATCRAAGLLRPMFNASFFLGLARAAAGDLMRALEVGLQVELDVERFDNAAYRPRVQNLLSWLWRELGEPRRALDHAQQALGTCELTGGQVEAEPAAHARLQLAECSLMLGDEAEAGRWLGELQEHSADSVAFGWRIDLHRLEVQARMQPSDADELLVRATEHGSARYQALALARLGRHEEAHVVAVTTGSDLLVAHVAPSDRASAARERLAQRLRPELRAAFLDGGACTAGAGR